MNRRMLGVAVLMFVSFSCVAQWDDCDTVDIYCESRGWLWIAPGGASAGIYSGDYNKHPIDFRFPWDPATVGYPLSKFYMGGDSVTYGSALAGELHLEKLNTGSLLNGSFATYVGGPAGASAGLPALRFRRFETYKGPYGFALAEFWYNMRSDPRVDTFLILAREGRVGGRWLEFQVEIPYAYYTHYDNCDGWDPLSMFDPGGYYLVWGGGSGKKGKVYVRTVWRVRLDVVEGDDSVNGSDPGDVILNGIDVVSRLDADPRSLGSSHYFGPTIHADGSAVQFGMRGTVVNLPREDSQFGFADGNSRIPLFLDPPSTTNSISSISPFGVVPMH